MLALGMGGCTQTKRTEIEETWFGTAAAIGKCGACRDGRWHKHTLPSSHVYQGGHTRSKRGLRV